LKRGQINEQVFAYILTVIVSAVILFLGYNYISGAKDTMDKTEVAALKNKIALDVETIGKDYGTFSKKSYSMPQSTELCLIDLGKKGKILETELIVSYALIKDSLASGIQTNAFLVGKSDFKSFFVGNIELNTYPYFKCLKPENGKITVGIEGLGDKALILTNFKTSINLDSSRQLELESPDDIITISIPKGTESSSNLLSIEMVDHLNLNLFKAASDIYKISPTGITFSEPVELKIKYNPATVGECPSQLVYYQLSEDGIKKLSTNSDSVDCKSKIAIFHVTTFI